MGYRIAHIKNLDKRTTFLPIDFGVSELRGGDDANYYTLLVGNNGSGKSRVLANSVYIGKSEKGANLIVMCHLYRLQSVEEKAKKIIMAQSPVCSIYSGDLTEDERIQKIEEVRRQIREMNQNG